MISGDWAGETCRIAARVPGPGSRGTGYEGVSLVTCSLEPGGFPGVEVCLRARLDIQEWIRCFEGRAVPR